MTFYLKGDNLKNKLDITITDAFEVGKIEGMRELLTEFKKLDIIDLAFKAYIAARLRSLNEEIALMNSFTLAQKDKNIKLN